MTEQAQTRPAKGPSDARDEQTLLALCKDLDAFNEYGPARYSRAEMAALLRRCFEAMTEPKVTT